jgi:hypothetical protein
MRMGCPGLLAVILICCGGPRTADEPTTRLFACPDATTDVLIREKGVLPSSGPAGSVGLGVCGVVLFPGLEGEVHTCQSPSGLIEGPIAMATKSGDARVEGQCVAGQAHGTWTWFLNGRTDMKQHYDRGTLIRKEQL